TGSEDQFAHEGKAWDRDPGGDAWRAMKDDISEPEQSTFTDSDTGARVRQMTNHASISHPTYFLQSSFFPGDASLVFTSYRTGSSQLFEVTFPEGTIRQMTDGDPIHPFSPAIHPSGECV